MRILLAVSGLLACALASAQPRALDDLGRSVVLDAPAQRIVTLAPHATELTLAAGAAAQLVGVAAASDVDGLPPDLAVIGGPGAIDRERLLALRPDLVIAWQSGNRAADIAWLSRANIPVYLTEPRSLDDIEGAIRAIGSLTGNAARAAIGADAFATALDDDCRSMTPLPVYVAVWQRPRLTLGGDHWINDVLAHGGWRNVFGHVDRGIIALSDEAAAAQTRLARVSLIRRFDGSADDRLADLLSRPGPRLADAVRHLCALRRLVRDGNAIED